MTENHRRTWKSQDVQARSPLSWCHICGSELYFGMKQDGFCPRCRKRTSKKRGHQP